MLGEGAEGRVVVALAELQKIIAEWRNRIETTFGEITDLMELAGACSPEPQ